MLANMLLLLASLVVAPAYPPAPAADDPFAGLYACTPSHGTYVLWLGERDGDRLFQRLEMLWPEDYPHGTKMRNHGGSGYRVRGGAFSTMSGSVDFEGTTLHYDGAACVRAETFADLLRAFDLDPAALAQEIMDIEGGTEAQAMARLDDADLAYAALGYEDDNLDHPIAAVATGVTLQDDE
ncbi:MAG: hypothetical protein AAGF99_17170 [Bacteroidota bacterium]